MPCLHAKLAGRPQPASLACYDSCQSGYFYTTTSARVLGLASLFEKPPHRRSQRAAPLGSLILKSQHVLAAENILFVRLLQQLPQSRHERVIPAESPPSPVEHWGCNWASFCWVSTSPPDINVQSLF
jgi:hypothetical protein